VTENIGKGVAIQGVGATMGQPAALIENYLSRFKHNLVATVIIIVDYQGPILIYLLVNINN
jgi:hypothetical protein